MGLYDELRCERALPAPDAQELLYQFKDMDCPYMEQYVMRPDGSLWKETYDVEDRSDPNAEGLLRLCGMATRLPKGWERITFTGELNFYTGGDYNGPAPWWLEFSAYYRDGELQQLNLIQDTRPASKALAEAKEPNKPAVPAPSFPPLNPLPGAGRDTMELP